MKQNVERLKFSKNKLYKIAIFSCLKKKKYVILASGSVIKKKKQHTDDIFIISGYHNG